MMRTAKYLAASFLIACTAFAAPPRNTIPASDRTAVPALAALGCADFLALMGKKPVRAHYVGCAYLPGQQGKPLRATYRVDGRFAGITETYLVKTAGLNRLKRSCCQWDSPAHRFKDAKGKEYSITMVSDETPVATRAAWPKIPVFEIMVETLTEEI